jgi:anaerobic selenocysteine-containing dehydrogenase
MSGEQEATHVSEKAGEEKPEKVDIKKLVSIIPPAAELFGKRQKGPKEKRIRLLYDESVSEEEAKISPALAKELGIKDFVEISVAGRKRFRLKVRIDENASPNYVYVNPELMKRNGVANNSICTIRAA